MKRIIKGLYLLIIVMMLLVCICPLNTYALNDQTQFVDINDTQSLEVGNLYFKNISFKDHSSTSALAFGLSGLIVNNSDYEISYSSTVYYYDSNYNLINKTYIFSEAPEGTSSFNQMSNMTLLAGHDISEISYFRLVIDTYDDNELEETEKNDDSDEIDKEDNDTSSSKNPGYNTYYDSLDDSKTPSKNPDYSWHDYVIDKYDIDIVVNENNTFDITETITAYFNEPKHGIFRTIPLINKIKRLDGTTSKNRAQIMNLSVDNEYTIAREYGNYVIKIGSASETITGKQTYVIKYTYNLGKDPAKDYDELYYNIIGSDWDTAIGNITFEIEMPKDFDSSKLGFSSGKVGSTDNTNIKYVVSGNKITGSYDGILGPEEALTVRCELDEGYFVGASFYFNIKDYINFLFPIIFLGISIFIWYKYGRDIKAVETVEFYPPEGFNSLEIGFLYKGEADNQDVTSLLIYLANKGYIKIKEYKAKSLFSKVDSFKVTKLKDYDGDNINESLFLNGLFTKIPPSNSLFAQEKDEVEENNINEVKSFELYNSFYQTCDEILNNINNEENKSKIFEKSSFWISAVIIVMIIATFCFITIPPFNSLGLGFLDPFALIFPGVGFSLSFAMVLGKPKTVYVNGKATHSSIVTKIFGLVWGGFFGGIPWLVLVLPVLLQNPIYLIGYIVGLVCVVGMMLCFMNLSKRTKYGSEILGKIKGFKNFLETAERDNLEAMVKKNPTYFYDILPYTYVLGVSDTWIKKFEMISIKAPEWYDSSNSFSMVTFGNFMSDTMTSAQYVMSSSPSSGGGGSSSGGGSSGGGSSGGGSSGGGSGGGGGGSW